MVVAILKQNQDPVFPQNYCPISPLSSLCKVSEAVTLSRFQIALLLGYVMQDEQFEFREEFSTELQLFCVTEAIHNSFELTKTIKTVFLDFTSAFDTVWHRGFIFKRVRVVDAFSS